VILIENLRQSCIFKYSKQCKEGQDCLGLSLIYWDYMIKFAETCASATYQVSLLEHSTCANLIIESLNIDKSYIDGCIAEQVKTCNTYLI
jgi:hypothetical protein